MLYPKKKFGRQLVHWAREHAREDLPWFSEKNPYRVWISEIMLQQTQVKTVLNYYHRFLSVFPSLSSLATAEESKVLELWSGLGYYARARNLHRSAQIIYHDHQGHFPKDSTGLKALPGIGQSTANAISVFCYNHALPILDGNVKRILTRVFLITSPISEKKTEQQLWQLSKDLLPSNNIPLYTQALMDLGATICTTKQAKCPICPLNNICQAFSKNKVSQIPVRSKRSSRKVVHWPVLIIKNGNDFLLEERPKKGIWGGLWCLPIIDEADQAQAILLKLGTHLPVHPHSLTHLELRLQPIIIKYDHYTQSVRPLLASKKLFWKKLNSTMTAPFPQPMKLILNQMINTN